MPWPRQRSRLGSERPGRRSNRCRARSATPARPRPGVRGAVRVVAGAVIGCWCQLLHESDRRIAGDADWRQRSSASERRPARRCAPSRWAGCVRTRRPSSCTASREWQSASERVSIGVGTNVDRAVGDAVVVDHVRCEPAGRRPRRRRRRRSHSDRRSCPVARRIVARLLEDHPGRAAGRDSRWRPRPRCHGGRSATGSWCSMPGANRAASSGALAMFDTAGAAGGEDDRALRRPRRVAGGVELERDPDRPARSDCCGRAAPATVPHCTPSGVPSGQVLKSTEGVAATGAACANATASAAEPTNTAATASRAPPCHRIASPQQDLRLLVTLARPIRPVKSRGRVCHPRGCGRILTRSTHRPEVRDD